MDRSPRFDKVLQHPRTKVTAISVTMTRISEKEAEIKKWYRWSGMPKNKFDAPQRGNGFLEYRLLFSRTSSSRLAAAKRGQAAGDIRQASDASATHTSQRHGKIWSEVARQETGHGGRLYITTIGTAAPPSARRDAVVDVGNSSLASRALR